MGHQKSALSLCCSLQSKEQEMTPEEVGKRGAHSLLSQIHAGGAVDSLHQVLYLCCTTSEQRPSAASHCNRHCLNFQKTQFLLISNLAADFEGWNAVLVCMCLFRHTASRPSFQYSWKERL